MARDTNATLYGRQGIIPLPARRTSPLFKRAWGHPAQL